MHTGRLLHWLAIRVFVVAVAVIGVWLLLTGVVPTTPPSGGSFPVADSSTPAPSSTKLTVSPASSVAQGTAVTLSARVTRPTAAGTVQFKDGPINIGAPVTVSNGTASQTTSMLATGPHRLIAVFTPTDPMALHRSTAPATALTVTAPDGTGTLPTISLQRSGLSLDSPMPTTLDNRAPTTLDGRVPAALDNRAPTALDIRVPAVLDNQPPTVVDIRVPSILDNQAPSVLGIRVPSIVDIQVPTASDNRMPSDLDGRERTSMASGCSAASSASCSGKPDDRPMTSCHHSTCGSRGKCGSPNAMTSGPQQQPAQSTPSQSSSTANGATANGATANGATTNGATANGATANGATSSGSS
jgi:Bacterial Ig-like domain (group 3)